MVSSGDSTPTNGTSATPTSGDALSASCITAVPDSRGHVPLDACNSYYNFDPEFAPAVAVSVIFAILTTVHVVEAFLFKKRYTWVLIMGSLWETIAFILHSLGANNQQNVGYATGHSLLFLLAPLWINAFVYMTFARMMWVFLPGDKRIGFVKAQSISKYFVLADILTFIVQGVGGIMASPGAPPDVIKTGLNVYLAGLGIQEFFIVSFICLMIVFHRRTLLDTPTAAYPIGGENGNMHMHAPSRQASSSNTRGWKPLLYALYITLTFITIRIFYRIAEFAGGITPSNPIPFHEAYSYALDAFPMMLAILVLAILHPGRTLVGPESEFPKKTRAQKKAEKAAKKEAKQAKKEEKKMMKQGGAKGMAMGPQHQQGYVNYAVSDSYSSDGRAGHQQGYN